MCIPTAIVDTGKHATMATVLFGFKYIMVEYRNIEQWMANYIEAREFVRLKSCHSCGPVPMGSDLSSRRPCSTKNRSTNTRWWTLVASPHRYGMQSDMQATLHPHYKMNQSKNSYNTTYSKLRKPSEDPQVVVPRHHPECCLTHVQTSTATWRQPRLHVPRTY